MGSRYSVVDIVAERAERSGVRIPTEAKRADQLMDPELVPGFFITRKLVGSEVGHSPPLTAKAKNEWSYTPRPSLRLHGVCTYSFHFSMCLITVRGEGLILIIYRISQYLFVPNSICYWLNLCIYAFSVYTLVLTFRVCTDLLRVNLMVVYDTGEVRRSVMYYMLYIIRWHDFTHDVLDV